MKKTTQLFISAILIGTLSCTNNSPNEMQPDVTTAKVEYKVAACCDMMVDIWYRNELGEMTKIVAPDAALEWNKIITVSTPFEANMSAGFHNTSPNTGNCAVQILVNDVLVEDYPGTLQTSLSYTMFADYHIPQ